MFPQTCRLLDRQEIRLALFLEHWFREPRTVKGSYDFFLLKLDYFCEFVDEVMPSVTETVTREAAELRAGFHAANEFVNR